MSRPRIWIKSSFSSDTANCVEVRHGHGQVYVRDSKLGDNSPVQEWPVDEWRDLLQRLKWDWTDIVLLGDGRVEFGLDRHEKLTFTAEEWDAFTDGVIDEQFEIDKLREFRSSSSRRGVAEEVREGSDSAAGPDQAATGAGVPASPPVPVAAPTAPWHFGRAWSGHEIEDACPCVQEPCGLVATPDPGCVQHSRTKTIRQSHRADQCPALGAGVTWIEDPSLGKPQGSPLVPAVETQETVS